MVTSSYPKYPGDVTAPFIEGIAASVASLGHEVHVLAPYHPDLRRQPLEQGVHLHFFKYAPLRQLNIWGYAESLEADVKLKPAIYPITPLVLASSLWALRRLTSQIKFDVIHAHWVIPNGPVAALAASMRHLPLVISLHGSDVWVAERNPVLRRVARATFRRADGVSASSDDLRQRAIRIGAPRRVSQVIPYGVDPASFAPSAAIANPGAELRDTLGLPADCLIIFSVGRMVYKKGFEYLIRAMPAVLAAHPNARLVLAGGGDLLDELKALAASLGIADRVSFPGWVERDQIPLYFSGCDLFVLPSIRDEAGNVDGLPNTLLEAMASGRSVVASRVAGVPLAVIPGQNGELVAEKDPVALVEAINRLLADPALRERYGAASRRRVLDDLNWTAVAARFVDLYGLAQRHHAARKR